MMVNSSRGLLSQPHIAPLLGKMVIPPLVAKGLVRSVPEVAVALAENPYLDSSVFADESWKGRSELDVSVLMRAVPPAAAARWVGTSDRRKEVLTMFLQAWVPGTGVQRELLRTRRKTMTLPDVARAVLDNSLDQDLALEHLIDDLVSGAWPPGRHYVVSWLAHNPQMVTDATFVDWISRFWVSTQEPNSDIWAEVSLALSVRPHLVGALLDRVGVGAAAVAAEVDAPGNIDQILGLLPDFEPITRQVLNRLICHPGLDADLRADLCSRIVGPGVWQANQLSGRVLTWVPSGPPVAYSAEELRRAVRFYAGEVPEAERFSARGTGYGPLPLLVDVVEGMAMAAVRHRKVAPTLGPALQGLLANDVWTVPLGRSHRWLGVSRALAGAFAGVEPLPDSHCGTHRHGQVPPTDSVLPSDFRRPVEVPPVPGSDWRSAGQLPLRAVVSSLHFDVTAANLGRYLSERLGSSDGDVAKWVTFLHLVTELDGSVLFGEAVDVALAL